MQLASRRRALLAALSGLSNIYRSACVNQYYHLHSASDALSLDLNNPSDCCEIRGMETMELACGVLTAEARHQQTSLIYTVRSRDLEIRLHSVHKGLGESLKALTQNANVAHRSSLVERYYFVTTREI